MRPAGVLHGLRIDDLEVEAELLLHLVLPFQAWTGRADDDRRAGAVTKEELLHDQPGLDRLAKVARSTIWTYCGKVPSSRCGLG